MPAVAPFDLWNRESPKGVKLYVQRVFITDQATQFLPLYLRFIRGIVDSSELALNVSRELLQQDEAIGAMRTALTRRVLDMLERLAEDAEKYAKFWGEFGAAAQGGARRGLRESRPAREAPALQHDAARPATSRRAVSRNYLDDAKPEQKAIYYLDRRIADGGAQQPAPRGVQRARHRSAAADGPARRVGHAAPHASTKANRARTCAAARSICHAPKRASRRSRPRTASSRQLLKRVKQVLRDRVDEVRVGGRLRQSAACLVLSEHDLGYQMRELLAAAGHKAPATVPSLELNPEHALVQRLDRETDPARFERLALLLFEQAVLAEGPAARGSGRVRLAAQRALDRSRRRRQRLVSDAAPRRRLPVEIAGPAGALEAAIDCERGPAVARSP